MTFCGRHSDKLTTLSSWRHVLEAKRVGLRILNFGGDVVDTRSATGRLMLNMFAVVRAERRHEPAHSHFSRHPKLSEPKINQLLTKLVYQEVGHSGRVCWLSASL